MVRSGKAKLTEKIGKRIATGKPIQYILLAFPQKSDDSEKRVLAPVADVADFVGLLTLNNIAEQTKAVYAPGAEIMLYTREVQLDQANEITRAELGIPIFPEEDRVNYQRQLRDLIKHAGLATIKVCDIDGIEDIYKRVEPTTAATPLSSGMRAFYQGLLDTKRLRDGARTTLAKKMTMRKASAGAQQHLQSVATKVALCMNKGAQTMRTILQNYVPEYDTCVRLSVRAPEDGDISSKIGINLVHGSQGGVPWINVLVVDPSSLRGCYTTPLHNIKGDKTRSYTQRACMINGMPLAYMQCEKPTTTSTTT